MTYVLENREMNKEIGLKGRGFLDQNFYSKMWKCGQIEETEDSQSNGCPVRWLKAELCRNKQGGKTKAFMVISRSGMGLNEERRDPYYVIVPTKYKLPAT